MEVVALIVKIVGIFFITVVVGPWLYRMMGADK